MVKYIFIATPVGSRWGEIFKFKSNKAAMKAQIRIKKEGNTVSGIAMEWG